MITDEQVRGIGLFFFLTLMDEKMAIHAAQKAVAQAKAQGARGGAQGTLSTLGNQGTQSTQSTKAQNLPAPQFIRLISQILNQSRKQMSRVKVPTAPTSSLVFGEGMDLTAWTKFRKESSDSEVVAVALAKVLKFSESDIAEGMNLSIGTVRYRIGKGIRQLGSVNRVRV